MSPAELERRLVSFSACDRPCLACAGIERCDLSLLPPAVLERCLVTFSTCDGPCLTALESRFVIRFIHSALPQRWVSAARRAVCRCHGLAAVPPRARFELMRGSHLGFGVFSAAPATFAGGGPRIYVDPACVLIVGLQLALPWLCLLDSAARASVLAVCCRTAAPHSRGWRPSGQLDPALR